MATIVINDFKMTAATAPQTQKIRPTYRAVKHILQRHGRPRLPQTGDVRIATSSSVGGFLLTVNLVSILHLHTA
jgi:hypothetical protein